MSAPQLLGQLHTLAGDVLKLGERDDALFAERSFIELGGNSLLAMLLAARASAELGVDVPIPALLGGDPLSAVLAGIGSGDEVVGEVSEVDDAVPTSAQRGMWAAEQVVGEPIYHLVFSAMVDGALDADLLERAIALTVARHDGLRTRFPLGSGELRREVLDSWSPALVRMKVPVGNFADQVRRVGRQQSRQRFSLESEPPLRFALASAGSDQHALVLVTHHMLLDGWAIGLVLKEVFAHYAALAEGSSVDLPEAPRPAALHQREQTLRASGEWDRQCAHWDEVLADVPTTVDLPGDTARPPHRTAGGVRMPFELPAGTSAAITRHAADLGVTSFSYLLTCYGLLVARYTGVRRFLVGVPIAGRPSGELRDLVSQCASVVPVVIDIDEDLSAGDQVRLVHRSLVESLGNADLPLDELVRRAGAGGDTSRNPLVHLVCSRYDDVIAWEFSAAGLSVRLVEGHAGSAPMDLTLAFQRSDPFGGLLEFSTGVWTRKQAEGFLANYAATCFEMTAPNARVSDVRGISTSDRELLGSLAASGPRLPDASIEELFVAQVDRSPDAVAVRSDDGVLTYQELDDAAAVQADLLVRAGVRPGDVVAISIDRTAAEIVGLLGVLKAGAAYCGIDEQMPPERVEQVLRVASPAAAICDRTGLGRMLKAGVKAVACWKPDWAQRAPVEVPAQPLDQGRTAYVAFTSGSTGVPKGVQVAHRGVVRLVHDVPYLNLGPSCRFLRFAPLAFDASTLEVWGPLLTGGSVEVFPPGLPSPVALGQFVARRGVTSLWLTSGLFRLVADFAADTLSGVSQLLTGGDVVPPEHVAKVLAANPGLTVVNGYGPTENTTFTTVHPIPGEASVCDPLPIGRPVPHTKVYVLDDRGRQVPVGAVGELYTGGAGLAIGYLNAPEETARAFGHFCEDVPGERLYRTGDLVRVSSAGLVQFLGRRDDQVKLGGFRIEPEEIRRALASHPDVQDALVVAAGKGLDKQLIGVYIPAGGRDSMDAELAQFLSSRLPRYMVPTKWVSVERIPVTRNGKVDRNALLAAAA